MVELSEKYIENIKKEFPRIVGNCLRASRKKKGLTQTELGNASGKDRQYIYKIEKGLVTINVSTLKILLTVLDITFEDFFKEIS